MLSFLLWIFLEARRPGCRCRRNVEGPSSDKATYRLDRTLTVFGRIYCPCHLRHRAGRLLGVTLDALLI